MSTRKPRITEEDTQLFRQQMKDVKRLKSDKFVHEKHKPRAIPKKTQEDEKQALIDMLSDEYDPVDIQPGDTLSYCRPGLQKRVFRKLRSGQYSIADELDLHGLNSLQAKTEILMFLNQTRVGRHICVRIIHGKGKRSDNTKGAVLKKKVNNWLRQHDRVLAFHSARPVDGGTGAIYVLLKR